MALKAKINKLEDVEEKYRDLYVENEDGTFRLDAEGVEDVSSLKNALQRERDLNKKKGGEGLTSAEKEELAELRAEREKAEETRLTQEKNWQGLEQRLKEKHGKELETERSKSLAATERLFKTLKENAATQAIAKHKGRVAPLLPHVMNKLDVVEKDGEFVVVVKDGKDPRYSSKKPSDFMPVDELVETDFLKSDDFMGLFEGKGFSGSGAQGNQNGRGNGGAITISRDDAKDHSKYVAAKAEAVKAGVALQVVDA